MPIIVLMGGARALIASVGASISLVAGAALSLLVVSFVFAYDGLVGAIDVPASHAALVLEKSTPAPSSSRNAPRPRRPGHRQGHAARGPLLPASSVSPSRG